MTVALPAVKLAPEPGRQGALGGQVILLAQDAQGGSQAVALVEQFP